MILVYRLLVNFLYPFLFIFLYLRIIKKKEDPKRFKEKILVKSFNVKKNLNTRLLWFHAASIGEFKSIIPIIEKLNENYKNYQFLVTTTTLSSSNLAKTELKKFNNVEHRFIPFDVGFLMENFLESWKPDRIFLVDSEIWPNLILKAKAKRIPIALINARITKKSFNRWSIFPGAAKKVFNLIKLSLCSNQETKSFLKKLDAKNVKCEGNIKFSNKIELKDLNDKNKKLLSKARFWIAASIHKEEDIFCLRAHLKIKREYSDVMTIIAPRHLNKVNKIKSLSERLNLKAQILNNNDVISDDTEIVIINFFGALQDYFLYAKSVFMGKSTVDKLKNDSGQNPIDAAKMNCKIYHGPYVSNFNEVYEILRDHNISHSIKSYDDLGKKIIFDLKNPKKEKNVDLNSIKDLGQNILSNTMTQIENFLNDKTE